MEVPMVVVSSKCAMRRDSWEDGWKEREGRTDRVR
jgi:hypothetical protein